MNSTPPDDGEGSAGMVPSAGPRAFLEQLDHDLRTPLGTMAAALELMRNEPAGTPTHKESIAVLQRQIARLHSLTEALREFSQNLAR